MSFFKRENKHENKFWFMDEIHRPEQDQRIRDVFRIREYLLRKHDILMRPDTEFKDGTFTTSKMVFQTIKSVVEGHTSYVVGDRFPSLVNLKSWLISTRFTRKGAIQRSIMSWPPTFISMEMPLSMYSWMGTLSALM